MLELLEKHNWGSFLEEVRIMNRNFKREVNLCPQDKGVQRMVQFRDMLRKELTEIEEIIDNYEHGEDEDVILMQFADLLGDLIVYEVSESQIWGIPIGTVLSAIMRSQASKLVNGEPIPGDMPGKFGKGPNYVAPEGEILTIIQKWQRYAKQSDDGVDYAKDADPK